MTDLHKDGNYLFYFLIGQLYHNGAAMQQQQCFAGLVLTD